MTSAAADLDRGLMTRLNRSGVRIDIADGNTVALKNVPANAQRFTKPRTNLLVQRPRAGMPFVVGVDEDLVYVGPDAGLARVFAGGHRQRGWRVLGVDFRGCGALQQVVERALEMVGFDGEEPALAAPEKSGAGKIRHGLLAGATSLTEQVRTGDAPPTVGRAEEVETIVAALLQKERRLPVALGVTGVGKTHLLYAAAARLAVLRPWFDVIRLDLAELFAGTLFDAERENVLARLLTEASAPDLVLCLERIDLVRRALPEGPLVVASAVERGVRLIGTAVPQGHVWLCSTPHRFHLIEVAEPDEGFALDILLRARERISAYHLVSIDDSVTRAAVDRAKSLRGAYPSKAVALLDAAATRAALAGSAAVDVMHVYIAANDFPEKETA